MKVSAACRLKVNILSQPAKYGNNNIVMAKTLCIQFPELSKQELDGLLKSNKSFDLLSYQLLN